MLRKTMLLTALCISSVSLTGCSSMWSAVGNFSDDMAEFTKFSWLRGSATKNDISFAETATPVSEGLYKTEVGEYVPTHVEIYQDGNTVIDTSPVPCPEGTFLNAENTCMYLETEQYDNMISQTR